MTNCNNCGRPWGVILERGELPTESAQQLAQLELEESLMGYLEDGIAEGEVVNLEGVPEAEAQEVVFVTEALADFASENFDRCIGEVPAWYELDDLDIPVWLLKGRARRWAYRWDCCDMDLDGFVIKSPSVQTVPIQTVAAS
jgi:hypothetical protein